MGTAHRVAYRILVGPVEDELHIDHLCRNRACVNPSHLEAVTAGVNVRRGQNHNRDKECCPAGHSYSPDNVYVRGDGRVGRRCKACVLAGQAMARRNRQHPATADVARARALLREQGR